MAKKLFQIDLKSPHPKYRQIMDTIVDAIDRKILIRGDKIPSINQICSDLNLSRDTVMYAFNELKAQGIVRSQPGKGYYVSTSEVHREERIFVLFDELNAFKEDLYNSLIVNLKGKASVDIFFHHFNYKVFKNLIKESIGNYTSYVIMPATFDSLSHLLYKIPKDKLFILDRYKTELKSYPMLYQDFESDFCDALHQGIDLLKKYRRLVFIHPGGKEPHERVKGFERFCKENNFDYQVAKSLDNVRPALYEAFFLISDRDLVQMIKLAKDYNYKLGKKFGIVSFNDTMLKEVVAGGITTISTDFVAMGKTLAEMVLSRSTKQFRNPSKLIVRNSL